MVSVIIPCYNSAAHIGRAIESVLKQSFTDWELLIVNNNSTDNTQKIIEQYQRQHPEKLILLKELKKGAAAARNTGVAVAKGDWLQFLDADDELLPEKLQRHNAIAKKGICEIIAGSFIKENIDGDTISYTTSVPYSNDIWKGLISTKLGITSANFWNKAAVVATGGWDETLTSSQDYDLLFKMMKNDCRIHIDKEPLANVFMTENSVSRGSSTVRFQEITNNWLKLRLDIKNYLQTNGLFSEEMRAFFDRRVYMTLKWYGKFTGTKFINNHKEKLSLKVPFILKIKSNNVFKSFVTIFKRV